MTLLVIILVGLGGVMILSSVENTPLGDTFRHIINGDAITPTASPSVFQRDTTATASPSGGTVNLTDSGISVPPNTQAWINFDVSQAHTVNGETGIDLATPFHTAITALQSGEVVQASYGPWGGSVWVKFQQGAQTLYANYLHLDDIMVSVGQKLTAGTLVGISGGQLSGGDHPAREPYSSGAHTEYGLYTTPYATLRTSIDPSSFLRSLGAALRKVGGGYVIPPSGGVQ